MHKPRASNDQRYAAPPDGVGGSPRVLSALPGVIRWTLLAGVAVALMTAWLVAGAEILAGHVIGITDGDGLRVLVEKRQMKIRLRDVDAPEARQAFGTRSKQSLSEICFNKPAELDVRGKHQDRYLATVVCAGLDANTEQVRRGMAWVSDRYVRKSVAPQLYALQADAKAAGRGLWADPAPLPPWEWRRNEREKQRR